MRDAKPSAEDADEDPGKPGLLASLANVRIEADASEAAAVVARQGVFLTASGSLIQFNAIMAAIHGSVLGGADQIFLKASFATALLLHVLAAFVLCWAARPVDGSSSTPSEDLRHADDTFRNYRRGWRMTSVALAASAAAAVLFVSRAFGFL